LLKRCQWPGNIRELRNVLEQACMLADGTRLTEADIRGIVITPELAPADTPSAAGKTGTYEEAFACFERDLINRTLRACNGKVSDAARQLGIGRATLYKKIAALGIVTQP
jgi:transcriptional regulator of acetoin/glycerol metabolism